VSPCGSEFECGSCGVLATDIDEIRHFYGDEFGTVVFVIEDEFAVGRGIAADEGDKAREGSNADHIDVWNERGFVDVGHRHHDATGSGRASGQSCDQCPTHRTNPTIEGKLADDHEFGY
jgi:hypothetical protein